MKDEQLWAITYVSVLAMRLHPKNDGDATRMENIDEARRYARLAANNAVLDYNTEGSIWRGSEQP